MLGSRKTLVMGIVLVAVGLTLSACGGADKTKQAATETTQTTETTPTAVDITPAGVQKCLTAAGFEVVANGDLPIIQRSKAVGVRLSGGGNVMPGSLSGAIFWYESAAKAQSMHESVQLRFKAVLRVDKIVAVFDPAPSGDTQTKVLYCITGA